MADRADAERLQAIRRYAVHSRELHQFGNVRCDIKIEEHPTGNWVKWEDVVEQLTAHAHQIADLVRDHNALLADGARWQTRAEEAESKVEAQAQEIATLQAQVDNLLHQKEAAGWSWPESCGPCHGPEDCPEAELRERIIELEKELDDLRKVIIHGH